MEKYLTSMKESLGSAWNDRLIEPAKAFHAAASRNIATTEARATPQSQPQLPALCRSRLNVLIACRSSWVKLGPARSLASRPRCRSWRIGAAGGVCCAFCVQVVEPAETFFSAASETWSSLVSSANDGRVSLVEVSAGMRVQLGKFWTKQLQEPTQHIYSLFVQDLEKAAVAVTGSA